MSANIIDALAVAAEITGATLSAPAMKGIAMELSRFPEDEVLKALAKCRRELKHRLTLADIMERLDKSHGFIGADEAWSLACQAMDESATVIMTDEIAQAWAVARDIMPDRVGARMAFRDVYTRLVDEAKDQGRQPKWFPSLGHDKHGREPVLKQAVQMGRLTYDHVQQLLPAPEPKVKALPTADSKPASPERAMVYLAELKAKMKRIG